MPIRERAGLENLHALPGNLRQAQAANERRVWARSDEQRPPVWDRSSGQSRFDPRPEPTVQVKLICPTCRAVNDFARRCYRNGDHRSEIKIVTDAARLVIDAWMTDGIRIRHACTAVADNL